MNYVLHLLDRPDREETMKRELDSFCPGEWEVFPGHRHLANPKIGISRSIRALLALAKAQGLERVHMFEDDVKFCSKDSRHHWDACVAELPPDWDILLGGSYGFAGGSATPHLRKLASFCSLHCTLFRNTVFDRVQEHQPERGCPVLHDIDSWLSSLGLNVYLCEPQVAVQYNGFSDNARSVTNYDSLLANCNLLL